MVDKVLNRFLKAAESGVYDHADVDRVKTEACWIEKTLMHYSNGGDEDAFNSLDKIMKTRKANRVNKLTEESFPREIYKIALMNWLDNNDNGQPNVWIRLGRLRQSPEFHNLTKDYITYFINLNHDLIIKTKVKSNIIFDFSDLTLSSIDFDIYYHLLIMGQTQYLCFDTNLLLVNMATIVVPVFNQIKAMAIQRARDNLQVITVKDLTKFVDKNKLPKKLNGLSTKQLPYIPLNAKSLDTFSSPKFTSDQIKAIYTVYEYELKPNSF